MVNNEIRALHDIPWLDKEKKAKFKKLKGSANSRVDLNKMREELKYGDDKIPTQCTSY